MGPGREHRERCKFEGHLFLTTNEKRYCKNIFEAWKCFSEGSFNFVLGITALPRPEAICISCVRMRENKFLPHIVLYKLFEQSLTYNKATKKSNDGYFHFKLWI